MTEPAQPPRRRRPIGLIIASLAIVFLLIGEAALVAFVFISPDAAESLSEKVQGAREVLEGSEDKPGLPARISQAATRFYQDQVVTLWVEPNPSEAEPTFTKCADCHPGYEEKVRFTHVYMNHPLHAQEGLECAECHTGIEHPSPDRPAEAVCAECHDEVNEKGGCDFCHPPGTLPHFYLLGAPRQGFIQCATCHPRSALEQEGSRLVHVGSFSGDPDTTCLKCHTKSGIGASEQAATIQPASCNTCHGEPHPSDWIRTHREAALSGLVCTRCHTSTWCSMACHAETDVFIPPLFPLPSPSEVITP